MKLAERSGLQEERRRVKLLYRKGASSGLVLIAGEVLDHSICQKAQDSYLTTTADTLFMHHRAVLLGKGWACNHKGSFPFAPGWFNSGFCGQIALNDPAFVYHRRPPVSFFILGKYFH